MNGADLLSVFLEDQVLFSDDLIVQNLLGFIYAATETTHFISQTIISHLAQPRFKESVKKIRDEFDRKIRQPAIEEDPSLADLPLREFLDRAVTSDRA